MKKYCTKEMNYITNLPDGLILQSAYQSARELCKQGRMEEALTTLEAAPGPSRDLFLHRESVVRALRQYLPSTSAPRNLRALETFGTLPPWNKTSALIISGPSGSGKSSLAKALIPQALFLSHLDRLRDFNPRLHSGLIFDDMSFSHIPREAQIHLLDFDDDREIQIRYVIAHIPAGTLKIFTTNLTPSGIFALYDPAVKRRVTLWEQKDFNNIIPFI